MNFREWSKVKDFLDRFKDEEDTFIYQVDNVTFVAVFDGECTMVYFKAELARTFDEELIIVELR